MTSRFTSFLVALAAAFLCFAATAAEPQPPVAVDLTGTWVLDPTISDDPRLIIEEAAANARRGMFRRGGKRRGGGMGGGRPDPSTMSAPEVLVFDQAPVAIRIDVGEQSRRLDYGIESSFATPNGTVRMVAEWKGDQLRVVSHTERGAKRTSWYSVNDGVLQVDTTVKASRLPEPLEFTLVYRAADAQEGES